MDTTKKTHRLDQADRDTIFLLRGRGQTITELATRYGVNRSTIQALLRKRGVAAVDQPRVCLGETQRAQVVALRQQGWATKAIAAQVGVKWRAVEHVLARAGVALTREQRRATSGRRLITTDQERALVGARKRGRTREDLAHEFGLSVSGVKTVLRRNGVNLGPEQTQRNAIAGMSRGGVVVPEGMDPALRPAATLEESFQDFFARYARAHGGQLVSTYGGSHERLDFICVKGHTWSAMPYNVQRGQWCPRCACVGPSGAQLDLEALVRRLLPGEDVVRDDKTVLGGKHLDIYVPGRCLALEYCGNVVHSETFRHENPRRRHLDKLEACQAQGVRLITMFSDEWLTRRPQVEGYLEAILGLVPNRLGAREATVDASPDPQEVRAFLDAHHLQGARGRLGLCLRHRGQVVAAATFKPVGAGWELVRYGVGRGTHVQGGLGRLLGAFRKDHRGPVQTFADRRWSQGRLYEALGFRLVATQRPAYWYIPSTGGDRVRLHRFRFRRSRIAARYGPLLPGETEAQAMVRLGFRRLWDCGYQKWVLDAGPAPA